MGLFKPTFIQSLGRLRELCPVSNKQRSPYCAESNNIVSYFGTGEFSHDHLIHSHGNLHIHIQLRIKKLYATELLMVLIEKLASLP